MLTWQLPRGRPIDWWVDMMCLRGTCSGRVTEVKYGSKVVWECVGVGSGHDKWEVVVYKLTTEGVNPGVVAGGRLGIVLWGSHRTGQVFLIRLFYSDGVGGMVCPLYILATGFYRGKTELVVVAVQGAPPCDLLCHFKPSFYVTCEHLTHYHVVSTALIR
jgi:hypothetical protein